MVNLVLEEKDAELLVKAINWLGAEASDVCFDLFMIDEGLDYVAEVDGHIGSDDSEDARKFNIERMRELRWSLIRISAEIENKLCEER